MPETDSPDTMAAEEPKPLLCEDLAGGRLILTLEEEGMVCVAMLDPISTASPDSSSASPASPQDANNASPALSPADLIWHLNTVNIMSTIDYAGVYDLCGDIELGSGYGPTVVARGVAPQTGDDGWFELMVKTGSEGVALVADEKGSVDHKKLNLFSEIEQGQKLGIVHPPAAGTPGMTVQGGEVPAATGTPYDLKIKEGVVLKYGDRVAFADKPGKVLFEKNTLSVVDYWIISGDLDLSIGNIQFDGFVEIKGDVPDDFRVVSGKGIKVHGHVGASLIESDGSIELASMAGKEVGSIICRGDLKAKFLNQVNVISYGHVFVANEIRNSLVKSTGAVVVENGVILGGKCVSLEGISTKIIGSESGVPTTVIAGIYFPDSDRFDYLLKRQQEVAQHLEKVSDAINKTRSSIARNVAYAKLAEKRMIILKEQFDQLVEEKERLSGEIASSKYQEFSSRNAKINVQGKVMENVSLILGGSHEKTKMVRNGPVSIIENTRNGGLWFLSLTPLSILASEIEEQLNELIEELPESK